MLCFEFKEIGMILLDVFLWCCDFLFVYCEDYDIVVCDFVWFELDCFNWVLDYFDVMVCGNDVIVLWVVDD